MPRQTVAETHCVRVLSPKPPLRQVPQLEKLTKELLCGGREVTDDDRARVLSLFLTHLLLRACAASQPTSRRSEVPPPLLRLCSSTTRGRTSTARTWGASSRFTRPGRSPERRGWKSSDLGVLWPGQEERGAAPRSGRRTRRSGADHHLRQGRRSRRRRGTAVEEAADEPAAADDRPSALGRF